MTRRALAITVAVVVAVALGGVWALSLDSTLHWAARAVEARSNGKLAFEGESGSLVSRVRADRVTWRGETTTFAAEDVAVAWSPLWLLARVVAFDHVDAAAVTVTTIAAKRGPAKLPEELELPLRLRFADAKVGTLRLVDPEGDARTFRQVELSFDAGPEHWKSKLAGVRSTWGTLRGEASVATAPPFRLDAALTLEPEGRSAGMPPLALRADASGTLSAFDLAVDAKAQASAADAKLRIEPLAAQPVAAIDATLHAVDVRDLFPDAPEAVLDGTLKASRAADGRLRGPLDITNRAAGTVDQRRVPLVKLTSELVAAPERWWLERLVFDLGDAGELGGTGWITAAEAGFVLVTDRVDLQAIHPALRTTRLAGSLHTSGPFERQRMRVALAERRIAFAADAVYEPRKLTVDRVDLRAGSGRFAAKGALALEGKREFALETKFASFDPSQFGVLKKANINGNLRASGELAPILHLRADGRLSNSTLFGLPVSAEARWASKGANDATIGFDVKATLGQTRFVARGSVTDPKSLRALDVALDLGGADLQELYTITGVPFPSTPEYRVTGNLALRDGVWTLRGFDGKVGRSDLTGDFVVDVSRERPFVRAELTSQRLDMSDLGGFIGHDYHAPDPAPDKLLPHHPFRLEKLNAADADVRLTGRSFRNERLPLRRLNAHLKLEGGRLTLDPLTFRAAGGAIEARVAMDARRAPIRTVADIKVRGLELAQLAPGMKQSIATAGAIDGRAELAMSGNSFAAMLGSADGSLLLAMSEGSVSDLVLRLANLDVAHAVTVLARGDKQIPIRCAVADFAAADGVLKPRTLVLDSEHTVVKGEGAVDLGTEELALRLIAEPKDGSVFALRGPIRVDGTLKDPAVHPELGNAILRTGAAIALGAIAPPAAIIPFLQPGKPQQVECGPLIEQATRFIEAAKPSARDMLAATAEPAAKN